jgi:hypothetical protein
MTAIAQRESPHLGIFWLVQATEDEARLLAAGCPLDQAEPYGDCLTYGPGHYETWAQWRRDRTIDHALRAIVRSREYEDWPRGRIVLDRSHDTAPRSKATLEQRDAERASGEVPSALKVA